MTGAPCKDCKDRHVGCHSTCERYIKQKEEHLRQKDEKFRAKTLEQITDKYIMEQKKRCLK